MSGGAHWIITNREVGRKRENGKLVERVLDTQREALPTFRVATFRPPLDDKATDRELADAVELVPDEHIEGYGDVAAVDEPTDFRGSKRLFLSLYQEMSAAQGPKGDTLFFIHGFNYSWPDALRHLVKLHRVYAAPARSPIARIVYFTWPSWGRLLRYKSDQQIAQPSGFLLGRVFAKAVQFYRDFFGGDGSSPAFCGRKIHLAAHSMGNQVLQEFIRAIREYDFIRANLFGEVTLLSADVDWTALEPGAPLASLPDYSQRVHTYNHFSDDALAISEVTKNDRKRLGRHGPRELGLVPARTLVVDCSRLKGAAAIAPGADPDLVAAAEACSDRSFEDAAGRVVVRKEVSTRERLFDHWGYLHRPEFIADLYKVFRAESSSAITGRDRVEGSLYRLKAAG